MDSINFENIIKEGGNKMTSFKTLFFGDYPEEIRGIELKGKGVFTVYEIDVDEVKDYLSSFYVRGILQMIELQDNRKYVLVSKDAEGFVQIERPIHYKSHELLEVIQDVTKTHWVFETVKPFKRYSIKDDGRSPNIEQYPIL